MPINVEIIGGSLMVQHYVETLGQKDHLVLESVSDIFKLTDRTTIHILCEMSVKAIDANDPSSPITSVRRRHRSSRHSSTVRVFLSTVFRAQRQPMSIAHNQGETPLFAASIERAALKIAIGPLGLDYVDLTEDPRA